MSVFMSCTDCTVNCFWEKWKKFDMSVTYNKGDTELAGIKLTFGNIVW